MVGYVDLLQSWTWLCIRVPHDVTTSKPLLFCLILAAVVRGRVELTLVPKESDSFYTIHCFEYRIRRFPIHISFWSFVSGRFRFVAICLATFFSYTSTSSLIRSRNEIKSRIPLFRKYKGVADA